MARAGVALSIVMVGGLMPAAVAAGARWSASADLGAGGGYDSNLFLQVAAAPDSPNFHPYAGAFLRVDPALEGAAAGDGYRLALRYGAAVVQSFGAGRLAIQDADLSLSLPEVGPVGLRLAGTAGRFDASDFASDAFWTWGGRGGVTVRLRPQLHAAALYEIDRRTFGDPATLLLRSDLGQTVRLRVDGNLTAALALAADGEYLNLRSDLVDATQLVGHLSRWRAGAGASYTPGPRTTLAVSMSAGTLAAAGVETDRQLGLGTLVSLRASDTFDLVARYELLVDRARSGGTDYTRQLLAVGLVGHAAVPRRRPFSEPGVPGATDEGGGVGDGAIEGDQAPRVDGGRVRFRLRAARAERVDVIGSWNDWRAGEPQQRLRRAAAGRWEGWLVVGPGEHHYHFLVDGRPVRPADAPRYRPDGFGGEDGVIEVWSAAPAK